MLGIKNKKEIKNDIKDTAKPKKEDSGNQANLDIKIERLEAQQEAMKEFINAFNERFENVNEQIGELRSTTIEHEKNIGKSEAISSKAMDLVSEVHPEELMSHLAKEEAKIEALKAKIESQNSISLSIIDDLKANKIEMSKFRGLEETMKLNKDVLKEISNIKKIEANIEKHSDRVETIFSESEKKFRAFENIKSNVSASDEKIKDMEKAVNQQDIKLKEFLTKEDISDIDKKTKKIDEIISKSKDFKNNEKKMDEAIKKTAQYKTQIDKLINNNDKKDNTYKKELNRLKDDIKKHISKTTKNIEDINSKKQYIYETYNKIEPLKMTLDILIKNEKKMINEFMQDQEELKLKISKLSLQIKNVSSKDLEKLDNIDTIEARLSRMEKEKTNLKKIEYAVNDIQDRFADKNELKDMKASFAIRLKAMQELKDSIRKDIIKTENTMNKITREIKKVHIKETVLESIEKDYKKEKNDIKNDIKALTTSSVKNNDHLKKDIVKIKTDLNTHKQSTPWKNDIKQSINKLYPILDNVASSDDTINTQMLMLQKYVTNINDKIEVFKSADTYPTIDIDKTIEDAIKKYELKGNDKFNMLKTNIVDINKSITESNINKNKQTPNVNLDNLNKQMTEKDTKIDNLKNEISELKILLKTAIKEFKRVMNEKDRPQYHERTIEQIMKELRSSQNSKMTTESR